MSAISGIFYRDQRNVSPETETAMMARLGIHGSDASGVFRQGPVFLGCHAQHITPESVGEILPCHDHTSGLTITADAIIDNRKELFEKLGITPNEGRTMPDSRLILRAYQKWGRECPRHLLGDFAFAVWNEREKTLFCAVDHTSNRPLYYYLSEKTLAFSTLIEPLFVLPDVTRTYNKKWIRDFLPVPPVKHAEITLYQDVYMLPAGHGLTVRPDGCIKNEYWKVERPPELRLKTDEDYEEAFREVLGEAVRCRMRCNGQVGVMISGGLDSTTVASLAARELEKSGRRLKAFYSAPMAGFISDLPPSRVADETPYVEAVAEKAGNIDVTCCRSEGIHPLSDTERFLTLFEQPYKNFNNAFWIDRILSEAGSRGIGVMLTGQAGNFTVTWGRMPHYARSLVRSGQWSLFLKDSRAFADRWRYPRLKTLGGMAKGALPGNIQEAIHHLRHARKDIQDRRPFIPVMDPFEYRQQFLNPAVFGQLGSFFSKMGLAHHLVVRDPTADRRVIDFCLSVPERQYVLHAQQRSLVRRSMAGILPDKVRLNETIRGEQSADWRHRLHPVWPRIEEEILDIGKLA